MRYRDTPRGGPSAHLPPAAFVSFLQNHDQVGNRAFGERIARLASPAALKAAMAIYLLAPQVPMLFMGEEWATRQAFLFFCDLNDDLRVLVRDGRRAEFASFAAFGDPARLQSIPDPGAAATFEASKLDWSECAQPVHRAWLEWTTRILTVRRDELTPLLIHGQALQTLDRSTGHGIDMQWQAERRLLRLQANLSSAPFLLARAAARGIWQEGAIDEAGGVFGPWALRWSVQ